MGHRIKKWPLTWYARHFMESQTAKNQMSCRSFLILVFTVCTKQFVITGFAWVEVATKFHLTSTTSRITLNNQPTLFLNFILSATKIADHSGLKSAFKYQIIFKGWNPVTYLLLISANIRFIFRFVCADLKWKYVTTEYNYIIVMNLFCRSLQKVQIQIR